MSIVSVSESCLLLYITVSITYLMPSKCLLLFLVIVYYYSILSSKGGTGNSLSRVEFFLLVNVTQLLGYTIIMGYHYCAMVLLQRSPLTLSLFTILLPKTICICYFYWVLGDIALKGTVCYYCITKGSPILLKCLSVILTNHQWLWFANYIIFFFPSSS